MFGDPYTNPKGWQAGTLQDIMVGKASNGFFAKPADYSDDGNAGIVCVGDVVNRKYSNINNLRRANADKKQFEKYKVQYGDMLFCRSSLVKEGIAKASIIPKECGEDILFECHVIRITLDKTKVIPEYMQAFSTTDYFRGQMMDKSKTATMTTIGQKDVVSGKVFIPSMDLQEEFVKFAEQTDKSKFIGFKSQFIELFGKLPEEFKHDTVALGDIADMLSGGTPSSKHPEYYGGPYPFVTTPCLGKNYIDSSDAVNWLSEIGVEKSSTHIIPAYSIMYGSRVGVGKSSINTCDMCTNQDILSFFNIDTSKYDLLFIKKVMDQYFDYVDAQKRGSTIKGVPSDVVKSIRIPVVAIEEQKSFAAFTEQSDKSKLKEDFYENRIDTFIKRNTSWLWCWERRN